MNKYLKELKEDFLQALDELGEDAVTTIENYVCKTPLSDEETTADSSNF